MFKKLTLALLTITMLLTLIPSTGFVQEAQSSAWQSSAGYAGAPYFYGVLEIRVPAGTPVDVSRGMFRTQAHDVYDGDITHLITRTSPSNPVINTASAGTTTVNYSVKNSRGTTSEISVNVIAESRANVLIRRRIHSRPDADTEASEIAGARRGNNHCGQHLGIYMPPNSNFRVRRIDAPIGGGILTLRNFAGISGQNNTVEIRGTAWETISHGSGVSGHNQTVSAMGRVPFINTPRNDNGHFTVELEFTLANAGSVRGLNYFHHGDTNQAQFLSDWTTDHMFAIISSNTVNMLVPWNDRPMLTGTGPAHGTNFPMHSINEILTYTNDMLIHMNDMHGLYIDAQERYNRLVHTRYMVVPAFGGLGAAFYGGAYTGMSAADGRPLSGGHTIYPYLSKSHLQAHEYAHGYDGNFSHRDYPLGDITTNVYVHYFRRNYAPQNRWWLYDYGSLPHANAENTIIAPANGIFPSGFREGLVTLISIMDNVGVNDWGRQIEVWRHIRQMDRRVLYERNERWSQADLFAVGIFEKTGLNMVPYLEWVGYNPSPNARKIIFGSGTARMPYYLSRLAGTQAAAIRTAEGIRGLWDAILPNPARNINANATLTLTIDDMSRIAGRTIRVMDGSAVLREEVVPANGIITFTGLPIGAYSIIAPTPTIGRYTDGFGALLVRAGQTHNTTINYQRLPYEISRARVNTWSTNEGDSYGERHLFDDDQQTIWHGRWSQGSGSNARVESFADIDIGQAVNVTTIELDKRNIANRGTIRNVRVWVHSHTGDTFPNGQTMSSHTAANVPQSQIDSDFRMDGWTLVPVTANGLSATNPLHRQTVTLQFNTPANTRYIRVGVTSFDNNGNDYVQVSEIRVFGTDDVGGQRPDYGDVNGDGVINAADITLLRRYIAATDKEEFRENNKTFVPENADANGDGVIDTADVTLLRKHLTATNPATVPLGPGR
jgi:PKD repeat protein